MNKLQSDSGDPVEYAQVTRFTTLWTQAQRSVFAFISATVVNFADAEDVLQKVSTVALSKFEAFSRTGDETEFIAWCIAIARYETLGFLRSKATDRHEFLAESLGQLAGIFEEVAPEYDDRREALAACISQLAGRPREVLNKRYGEGLKTRMIAEHLGLTAGNVSVILNRTYRRLRECINGRLASTGCAP